MKFQVFEIPSLRRQAPMEGRPRHTCKEQETAGEQRETLQQ